MTLHPQSQDFIDMLVANEAPSWETMTPHQAREVFASLQGLFGPGPDMASVEDLEVGGVPVRLYRPEGRPEGDKQAGTLLYLHGGGWMMGDLETHDSLCRRLAHTSAATVVSVDYRRPPEHPFPAALEDGYGVFRALAAETSELQVSDRIVLAGDSAGGNLAMAVSLLARDRGGAQPAGQVLIYPVFDQSCDSSSHHQFAEGYGLTRASMQWLWSHYLSDDSDQAGSSTLRKKSYASPADEAELSGLPPTHIITAEYDVLRDEGEAMAARLRDAGVTVTQQRYDGMLHGFVHFSAAFDDASSATAEIGERVQAMLATG